MNLSAFGHQRPWLFSIPCFWEGGLFKTLSEEGLLGWICALLSLRPQVCNKLSTGSGPRGSATLHSSRVPSHSLVCLGPCSRCCGHFLTPLASGLRCPTTLPSCPSVALPWLEVCPLEALWHLKPKLESDCWLDFGQAVCTSGVLPKRNPKCSPVNQ